MPGYPLRPDELRNMGVAVGRCSEEEQPGVYPDTCGRLERARWELIA